MADILKNCEQRIDAIPGVSVKRSRRTWQFVIETEHDSKILLRRIRQVQTELRAFKKELNARMKAIRQSHRSAIAGQTYRPGCWGGLMGGGYRAAKRRGSARRKRVLRVARERQLYPYQDAKAVVDELIAGLNYVKNDLQTSAQVPPRVKYDL